MLYAWDKKGSAFIQKVRVNRRAKMSVKFKKDLRINNYPTHRETAYLWGNYIWHVTMTNET